MADKVLALLYPGCVYFEIALAAELLARSLRLEVATPEGTEVEDTSGLLIKPHTSYTEVRAEDYRCVLVPGGDPASIMEDGRVDAIITSALANDAVVAGMCAGALVLAKTGVLRGRKATHNYTPKYAPENVVAFTAHFWQGLEYVDRAVVRDGNIITARPQAHIDFALTVCQTLGLIDEAKYRDRRAYYYNT